MVVGQILVGPNHDIGGDAGALQTIAAGVLLGPVLVTAAVRLIRSGERGSLDEGLVLRVGLVGAVAVLAAELVVTWFKLAGSDPWASVTGVLTLVRLALLAALVVSLVVMRRRGSHRMAVPALLITVWVAIGAAMTRIPPPQYFVPTSIPEVFMGFEVPDAPTFATLMSTGRLNLLFAVLAVVGIASYLRDGDRHSPPGREIDHPAAYCCGVAAGWSSSRPRAPSSESTPPPTSACTWWCT